MRRYGEYVGIDPQAPVVEEKDKSEGELTFDDLINNTLNLLRTYPHILRIFQDRYRYLFIDEYQDIDPVQKELFHILAGQEGNIFAIGDPDQAIYSFRGAHVRNFLSFQDDYRGVNLIRLKHNYRSTSSIVYGAEGVISYNRERIHKPQVPARKDKGEIIIVTLPDERSEIEFIASEIERFMGGTTHYGLYKALGSYNNEKEYRFSDFAILFRTNEQIKRAEEIWKRSGIPYQIVKGKRFKHDPLVDKALNLFRFILSPHKYDDLKPKELLEDNIHNILILQDKCYGFSNYIREILKVANLLDEQGKGPLEGLITMAMAWEGYPIAEALKGFIDDISLSSDVDYLYEGIHKVTLMTMHAAKGLEFPVVFICGAEEGLIPFILHKKDAGSEHIEEERRLFYVALTRARDMVYILHARKRHLYGKHRELGPSRFIREIPEKYCTYREIKNKRNMRKEKQLKIF